jgi:hypothetical protein
LDLRSTILARNKLIKQGQSPQTHNLTLSPNFTVTSDGHNLFDDVPPTGFVTVTSDQVNKMTCFNPLANYGGLTETMRPAACGDGSVAARDEGGTGISVDQRGEDRPVGAETDVGAFECQSGECGQTGAPGVPPPDPGLGGESATGTKEPGANLKREAASRVTTYQPSIPADLVVGRVLLIPKNSQSVWHDPLGIEDIVVSLLPTR